jgi:hypothetical protein
MKLLKVLYLINIELMKDEEGVAMRKKYFLGILCSIALWVFLIVPCFAQLITNSQNCVVTQKAGSNLLIVSCPDGSRTVDAGGRADLYRVGDRVDIYGLPGNQPAPLPGQTQ